MTETTKMIARETAERVAAYEREEGFERDDAFRVPQDVRDYADRFGWLDDVDADLSDLTDGEVEEFEAAVTDTVIEMLFGTPESAPARDFEQEQRQWLIANSKQVVADMRERLDHVEEHFHGEARQRAMVRYWQRQIEVEVEFLRNEGVEA